MWVLRLLISGLFKILEFRLKSFCSLGFVVRPQGFRSIGSGSWGSAAATSPRSPDLDVGLGIWEFPKIRRPQYSILNSRILIIRTPNKVPLIFGNSHLGVG